MVICLLMGVQARAQSDAASMSDPAAAPSTGVDLEVRPLPAASPADVFNRDRILGVIPDYQTVDDDKNVPPLTAREKWTLGWKESVDPFNIFSAAIGAALSQAGNQTPKYGEGWLALGKRFGAALGDFSSQNFFSAGLVATVIHQDPRYFRMGPRERNVKRALYSVSQLFIAKQDSGKEAFNASNIVGMMMGIAASNLYYPAPSRRGSVMVARLNTSLFGGVTGNLMSEFWPDLRERFFHRKPKP